MEGEVKEHFETTKAHIIERFKSPLFGAFVLSWLAINHQYLFILFSDLPVNEKFELAKKLLFPTKSHILFRGFLIPLGTALVFILIYPWPANLIYGYWIKMKNNQKEIEGLELLSKEEGEELKLEANQKVAEIKIELAKKNEEIESLEQAIKTQLTEIEDLKKQLQNGKPHDTISDTSIKDEIKKSKKINPNNGLDIVDPDPDIDLEKFEKEHKKVTSDYINIAYTDDTSSKPIEVNISKTEYDILDYLYDQHIIINAERIFAKFISEGYSNKEVMESFRNIEEKKLIRSIGSKTEITESGQKVVDTYRKDNKPEEVSKYNLLKEKSHSFNEDYVLEDTIESRIKILKIISTNDGLMSQKDLFKHLPGEFTEKIHFLDLLATEKLIEILIIDHFENVKITEKGIKYLNSVNLDKPGLYTPYGTTQTFKVSEKSQDELPDRAIDILKYLCDHDGKSTVAHLSNQLKINKVKTRYFFDVLDQRKLITVTIQPRYIEGKLTSEGRQYCADMGFLN